MASETGGVAALRELHALSADVNVNFRVDSKDTCGVAALQELHALAADVNVNFHVSRPPRRVKRRNSALKLSPSMKILSIAEEIFGAQHLTQAPDQQDAVLRGLPAARSAENADGDLRAVEPLGQARARAQQVRESWRGRNTEVGNAVASEPLETGERGMRRERLPFGFSDAQVAGGAGYAGERDGLAEARVVFPTRNGVGDVAGWWKFVGEMEGEMRSDCSGSSFGSCTNWSRCSSLHDLGSCFDPKSSPVPSSYNGSQSARW